MSPRTFAKRRGRAKSPREIALNVLYHVDTRKAFADLQLNQAFKTGDLSQRDTALATELVNGTLRWRARIDWVLGRYVRPGMDSLNPWILNVLRLGVYQMVFLDRIPPHAAVDESVKLAKQYGNAGAAGLVNAVLRKVLQSGEKGSNPEDKITDPDTGLAIALSHPEWLIKRWRRRYGDEETRALCMANNRTPALGIRVNLSRVDRETVRRELAAEGIVTEPGAYSKASLRAAESFVPRQVALFREGMFFIQDESETLVVDLLDPQAGERILDLCAAPGGKTTHIQECRANQGTVIAVDVQPTRLARIDENVRRLRLTRVEVVQADGRDPGVDGPFDRVLVDAPCSGIGVLARRSDARWRKTPKSMEALLPLQKELLHAGADRVKPGGVLVYSVCSNEPEEGQALIDRFIRVDGRFTLEDASEFVPAEVVEEGFLQMLPHRHQTDGAFAARLRRDG